MKIYNITTLVATYMQTRRPQSHYEFHKNCLVVIFPVFCIG
jgi:hypothetical protein